MRIVYLLLASLIGADKPALRHYANNYIFDEGESIAGNLTRLELRSEEPLRVVLHSTKGDADLYLSYNSKNVSFELHEHDKSSTTCGLDFVDVPGSSEPSYLAIYGHPSYELSAWRLLVIFGRNSTYGDGENEFDDPPETIYDWENIYGQSADETKVVDYIADILFELIHIIFTVFIV